MFIQDVCSHPHESLIQGNRISIEGPRVNEILALQSTISCSSEGIPSMPICWHSTMLRWPWYIKLLHYYL